MRIDFNLLKGITSSRDSNPVKNSSNCLFEFTSLLSNLIEEGQTFTEEEMAFFIISMQNWIHRKTFTKYFSKSGDSTINLGDVFFADLGIAYKPEIAYNHPVIILEKIKGYVLVVPITSSTETVKNAYHPEDNPKGDKKYLKIKKTEGVEKDCAAILTQIRTISPGRLLQKKSTLSKDIFNIVKDTTFYYSNPKKFSEFNKNLILIDELKSELTDKTDRLNVALEEIESLKSKLYSLDQA